MEVNRENYNFIEKEAFHSPLTMLGLLTLLVFLFSLIGSGIIHLLGSLKDIDFQTAIANLNIESTINDRNFIRSLLGVNHLFTFIIPSLFFSFFLFRKQWAHFLKLHKSPHFQNVVLGILIILAAFPLAQFSFWLNKQIPLPSWANTMEERTSSMISNLLIVNAPYELFLNILIIALIPAIGEEFIFRGIIQQKCEKIFNNKIAAIWFAAIIFSAIHLQFQGFIPRVLLGALLGYLFYWTNNLWIPIIAHFANNATQILMQYLYQEKLSKIDLDQIETFPIGVTIISIIFVVTLGYFIQKNNPQEISRFT